MFKKALLIAAMVTISASAFADDCSPGSLIYDDAFFKLCDREQEDARAAADSAPVPVKSEATPRGVREAEAPSDTESPQEQPTMAGG